MVGALIGDGPVGPHLLTSTIVLAGHRRGHVLPCGWEATRSTFFNGKYFVRKLPQVLTGLWLNIRYAGRGHSIAVFATLWRAYAGRAVFFPIRFLAAAARIFSEASFRSGPT